MAPPRAVARALHAGSGVAYRSATRVRDLGDGVTVHRVDDRYRAALHDFWIEGTFASSEEAEAAARQEAARG